MDQRRLTQRSMAFVLAGGRGSRLKELTDRRVKPAVYFGGKTRIVDFALSNAMNSGIRKMAIATQYKAHSLIRHCQRGWNFFRAERNEFLDILPASQRMGGEEWYRGTADAVTQNFDIVDSYDIDYVVDPGRRPHLQDGLRDHAAPACRDWRRRDRRLPDRPADGSDGLRRDGHGRKAGGSPISWKSRPIRRARPTIRTSRWPRWGSTSSRGSCCASCC